MNKNILNYSISLDNFFLKKLSKKTIKKYSPKYVYKSYFFLFNKVVFNNVGHYYSNEIYLNMKKFELFFYNYVLNKKNFIFFDTNYKSTYNLYQNMFFVNNLNKNKNYFFIKPKFFTFKNWIFYFYHFCKRYDINFIIISDYKKYSKYINEINNKSFIFLLFQPENMFKIESDFYFYVNLKNHFLQKFLYIVYINYIFYIALNDLNTINKNGFLIYCNRTLKLLEK